MEMDWKERQTVTVLLTVLAVLSAAVLIVLGIRYRSARDPQESPSAQGGDLAVPAGDHSSLTYYNGSVTLSFSLDEENRWVWTDDPLFPLDPSAVETILEDLETLKPQQTLSIEGESLETYGLEPPSATISLTNAAGTVTEMAFGKTTTDEKSYYMMKNHDASTLYIVDGALYRHMQTPIYGMCRLPALPLLTEKNLQSLTVQPPAPAPQEGEEEPAAAPPAVTYVARWAEVSQKALWFRGDDDVTGQEEVKALVRSLPSLGLAQCVDYRPSREAVTICGFDSPAAVLTARYTLQESQEEKDKSKQTEQDGAPGQEKTFLMEVGGEALDGENRYVRLGGDETIYAMRADLVEPLLTLAQTLAE